MQSKMYSSCNPAGFLGSGDPTAPESLAATTRHSDTIMAKAQQRRPGPVPLNPGPGTGIKVVTVHPEDI